MEYFNMAKEYYKNSDYLNAAKYFELAIKNMEIKPITGYYNLGTTYIKLYNYKKALIQFKKSLKYNGDKSKIYYNIGYCYMMLDNKKKAYVCFKASISLNDEDEDTKKALIMLEKDILKSSKRN